MDVTIAKFIACIVLLVVIIGFLPQLTGFLHWYITLSFGSTSDLITGGDHIAIIITFLMIPISLCDSRKWVWSSQSSIGSSSTIIVNAFHYGLAAQASLIYFHAFSGKLPIKEWSDGTALYYWLNHSLFGATDFWLYFLNPILKNEFGVVAFTWGALVIEILLFAAIFMSRRFSNILFILGVSFHVLIAMFHGLITFGMVMAALLYLYLLPPTISFSLYKVEKKLISWKRL